MMYKDIPKIEKYKIFQLIFVIASKTQPPKTDKANEKDNNFMYTFRWKHSK